MKMKKALFLVVVLYKSNWKNSSLLPILEQLLERKKDLTWRQQSPSAATCFFERTEVTYLHNPKTQAQPKRTMKPKHMLLGSMIGYYFWIKILT